MNVNKYNDQVTVVAVSFYSDKIVDKKDNFNGLKITCEDRYKIFDGLPSLIN